MNSEIFKYLSFLILSVVWNNILFVNASNFRTVKTYQFKPGQYYDTIEYEWDITPTDKVGMFDYNIQSNGAVSTLLMNSTDYYNWENYYYPEWVKKHEYTFTYLNDDFRTFQCKVCIFNFFFFFFFFFFFLNLFLKYKINKIL